MTDSDGQRRSPLLHSRRRRIPCRRQSGRSRSETRLDLGACPRISFVDRLATSEANGMNPFRASLVGCSMGMAAMAASNVTFNKEVLPVLQKNCQECHRPGEIAPMSLMTYADARPWAKAMKSAVLEQKMPPWFADPKYGHFANDRRLSKEETRYPHRLGRQRGAAKATPRTNRPPRNFPRAGRSSRT